MKISLKKASEKWKEIIGDENVIDKIERGISERRLIGRFHAHGNHVKENAKHYKDVKLLIRDNVKYKMTKWILENKRLFLVI